MAQSTTADITGTVTDNTGAILPNAKVTLTNLGTKEVRTATTTSAGDYTFTQLGPGSYSIQVSQAGFKSFVIPSISVSASDRAREDAKLEVGDAAQTVEVTGQAAALQTDSSVLTTVVTQKATEDLPLNGRNYVNLAQLAPGANEGPPNGLSSGGRPDDRRQTSGISINGQSDTINDWMIDGLDNNERIIGTTGIRPSIEAIREVNIQSNTYTAEVGRTAGGVINVITKSGSNNFHGSAYEFFRNDVLNAYPFQFGAHNPKPKLRQNQFGGSIGGPIIHNKTFFFADYEGLRQIQGSNPTVSQVPTLDQYNAIQSGNVAALVNGGPVDPVGLAYAKLYPAPNAPATTSVSGAYVSSPVVVRNSDTVDARVDERFNDKNLLYGRYSWNRTPVQFPGLLPTVNEAGLSIAPGGANYNFYGNAKDDSQNAQINYIHTFSPNLLLQLGFGYTRINNQSFPLNYGEAVNKALGQPNVNLDINTSGLTPVGIQGLADLGAGSYVPILDVDNTFQYQGTVVINRGAHNIKVGAALIRRQALNYQNNQGIGNWQFNQLTGGAQTGANATGLQALLQGNYLSVQRSNSLVPPHYRTWEPSAFVQDDWHATSTLTLNLGVRYDVFTPFTEAHNAISNFDPNTGTIILANQNGVNQYAGLNPTWTNLAPRIGFAYTVTPGTVLRGGFGISYFPMNYTSNSSLKNQPFVSAFSCNNGSCPTPTAGIGGPGNGAAQFQFGLPLPTAASATNPTGSIADPVDLAFRSSYLEQFNLTLEKAFGPNVVQATYVGMLGRHIAQIYNDENLPGLISNSALHAYAASKGLTDSAGYNTLRPYYNKLPNITQIGGYNSRGSSNYNALQLSVNRRTAAGLTLQANYTLAHGLDNVLNLSNEINDGYGTVPSQISTVDYGNSDVDIRNRAAVSGNYELPFGKSLSGISGALTRGWQANTILVWESGEPFTVVNSTGIATTTNANHSDRPNQVGSGKMSNPSIFQFFNPAAFVPQASGTLGTERKNPLYGPHYRHVDLSLFKTFPVWRETTLQFRAEAFNITNSANFANPNNTIQSNPSTTNPDQYVVTANNVGTISSTSANYNPRLFQFALKYQF
ncbi:MAG: Cna domain protein [Acidobacteriaceae bacterium]|nr:Cna domain protein [Acidobacteriaceae bacterium]